MKPRSSLFTMSLALFAATACVGAPDETLPVSDGEPGTALAEPPAGSIDTSTETGERVGQSGHGGASGGGGASGSGVTGGSSGEAGGAGGGGGQPPAGGAGTGGDSGVDLSEILFPPYPDLDHPALPELARARKLRQVLETTLGSAGDKMILELGGEMDVPVIPGVGVGGEVSIGFTVTQEEDDDGKTTFLLEGGAEAAAAANLSAGILGGSRGGTRGASVRWRFDTHADVVAAIQRMVILRVIGPRLEIASNLLHGRLGAIDGALAELQRRYRDLVDRVLGWFRIDTTLLDQMRRLQDERNLVRRGLQRLDELTGWVVDARGFLMGHFAGVKVELGTERKIEFGTPSFETGGDTAAIAGFQASESIERSVIMELETLDASVGVNAGVTLSFRKKGSVAGGGSRAGIALGYERKLEISTSGSITVEGIRLDAAGPNAVLSLDRSYHGTLGLALAGRYGLGRESSVAVSLGALTSLGAEAMVALIAGSPEQAAETMSRLPLEFAGQARIERGLMIGIGGEAGEELIGAKVYAEAVWADAGIEVTTTRTPSLSALLELASISPEDAIPEADFALLDRIGEQVVGLQDLR